MRRVEVGEVGDAGGMGNVVGGGDVGEVSEESAQPPSAAPRTSPAPPTSRPRRNARRPSVAFILVSPPVPICGKYTRHPRPGFAHSCAIIA